MNPKIDVSFYRVQLVFKLKRELPSVSYMLAWVCRCSRRFSARLRVSDPGSAMRR